ncbi:endothelin-converting enzyme 2-like [Haemaphysalis longicornis]
MRSPKEEVVESRLQSWLLVTAAATVGFVVAAVGIGLLIRRTIWQSTVSDLACTTEICVNASRLLAASVHPEVNPCDDFYKHVCGTWIRFPKTPWTFMADAARNFLDDRDDRLELEYLSAEPGTDVLRTASGFYSSCLAALRFGMNRTAIDTLLKDLHVTVGDWLKETSWREFFLHVVRLSVANHFDTLFKLNTYVTDNGVMYELSRGRPFHARLGSKKSTKATESFLEQVVGNVSGVKVDGDFIAELVSLDKSWNQRTALPGAAPSPRTIGNLSCGLFERDIWSEAFERHAIASGALVSAPQFGLTCADLHAVLVNKTSVARPVYLMALLSSHVLSYEFEALGSRFETTYRRICDDLAPRVFGRTWVNALSLMFSIRERGLRKMDEYVRLQLLAVRDVVSSRTWMSTADRKAAEVLVGNFTVLRFPGEAISDAILGCSRFGQGEHTSSSFVSRSDFAHNLVRLYAISLHPSCPRGPPNSYDELHLKVMLGTDIHVAEKTIMLPQFLGTPPVFYSDLEGDDFLNIATVAVLVGKRVSRFATRQYARNANLSAWSQETTDAYANFTSCSKKRYAPGEKALTASQFDDAFSVADAISAAMRTKLQLDARQRTEISEHKAAANALFLKRACMVLCGSHYAPPPEPTEVDFGASYAGCNIGVSRLPEFHEAFSCPDGSPMRSLGECFT